MFQDSFNLLNHLQKLNKQVYFLTNNSTKSKANFQKKLEAFQFKCPIQNIYSSSYSTG